MEIVKSNITYLLKTKMTVVLKHHKRTFNLNRFFVLPVLFHHLFFYVIIVTSHYIVDNQLQQHLLTLPKCS